MDLIKFGSSVIAMGVVDSKESELELCARMLRSLAHRIRGDLSVITNDLAYLETIIDPSELERARARCVRIATMVGKLGSVSAAEGKKELPLACVQKLFQAPVDQEGTESPVLTLASEEQLRHAHSFMRDLLGDWVATSHWFAERNEALIELQIGRGSDIMSEYSSVSTFASNQLGERFVVEAGLVDLLLRDHGWRVSLISEKDHAMCSISIPTVATYIGRDNGRYSPRR